MLNYLSLLFLSKTLIAQTGDESNVGLWLIVMGAAAAIIVAGIIVFLILRKKASKSDKENASSKKNKFKAEFADSESKDNE